MGFKILLVNPPFGRGKGYSREGRCTQEAGFWATPWPPYSLAMLAAVLRNGNSARILDCPAQNISENKLSAVVARSAPDIVMASVGTETIESDLAALEKIKALPFKPLVIIFGVHATVFAKDILENSAVDFVVRGEPEETARELAMRDRLWDGLAERIPDIALNGHPEKRLPNSLNFRVEGIEGEAMILCLDMNRVSVSSGSACTTGSLDPSHVLLAMGIPAELAHGSQRVTLGRGTTELDIDYYLDIFPPIVARLRDMSPVYNK